jgi:hypothetical protein
MCADYQQLILRYKHNIDYHLTHSLAIFNLVPTEATAERSFSKLKFIHTDIRNRLSSQAAIDELLIRFNHSYEDEFPTETYDLYSEDDEN